VTGVYAAIQPLKEECFPVSLLCECLSVSRSADYAWREDGVGSRQRDDNRPRPVIRSMGHPKTSATQRSYHVILSAAKDLADEGEILRFAQQ